MDLFATRQTDRIPGTRYITGYISVKEHNELLSRIDNSPWMNDLQRRVQHYGYKYSYKYRNVDSSMYLGPLPDWIQSFAIKLHQQNLTPALSDQAIVNEYNPGQGIAPHIDCTTCFDDTVAIITLSSACIMDFISPDKKKEHIFLLPKSLLILSGETRYKWKHGIAKRKSDFFDRKKHIRERRVSITFRKVIPELS